MNIPEHGFSKLGLIALRKLTLPKLAMAALVCAGLICAGILGTSGMAHCQEPEMPPSFPPTRPPDVLAPGIRPDVYWLRNAQGTPVAVPRVDYEEFERALQEASGEPQDRPPPALSQLDLVIDPETDFARVTVDASLRLPAPNRSWLSVPLGLAQLQWLPSSAGFDRNGVVAQSNGYVWRIEPGLARDRQLKLEAVCKMTASNSGNSLRLDLPSTATVVRLRLPPGEWDLTASGGGTEVVEPFRAIEDRSVAIVRTTANTLNLAWNRKEERQAIIAVEATSQTKFSPNDDGSVVKGVTTWSLRGPTSLGGKRFSIALPLNGEMRDPAGSRVGFSGYRVTRRVEENAATEGDAMKPWIFDVDVDESLARADLEIALEWQISGPANPKSIEWDAPTIEGVQSHSGSIECIIPRGVVFQWTPKGDARLSRQGPAADGSNAMVYAFQFASQPAGVTATWQSLINRPKIRATHQIDVRENTAVLDGRVDFLTDPTQLPLLQLEWSGWNIDRVKVLPSTLELDRNTLQVTEVNGRTTIPLNASLFMDANREATSAGNASGSGSGLLDATERSTSASNPSATASRPPSPTAYAIEFTLIRPLSAEDGALRFVLPQLSWLNQDTQQRTTLTPAGMLRVQSWMYRFREVDPMPKGLTPMALPSPLHSATPSPYRLSYQVGEATEGMEWVAERYRRPSSTAVTYVATPTLKDASIEWNHRWVCRSYGGRPELLMLGVPAKMALRNLQVEGASLEPQRLDPASVPQLDGAYVWYAVTVPRPFVDESQTADMLLTATSDFPIAWDDTETLQVEVDLPVLKSARVDDVLVIESAQASHMDEPESRTGVGTLLADHSLDPDHPRWESTLEKPLPTSERMIEVEAEWVQTILNAIYQRDRYVARFATRREWIDLDIPASLRKDLEIVLDGKRTAYIDLPENAAGNATDNNDGGRVRVELPPKPGDEDYVLEIFTLRPGPEGLLRRISLNSPRLNAKKSAAPLMWQVVVPRTEHLVWNSTELAPLYRWQWNDLFFARASDWTQQKMESELGASKQPEVTLLQTNQYDLTTLSGNQTLSAWFIPRSLIWLPIAATVLLLSMSMGERALLKKPWLWSGLLVAWMICSQWSWDLSILVAQTVLASLGLAMAYALLRWLLNRRARRRSIFVSRSSSVAPYHPRTPSSQPTSSPGPTSNPSPSSNPSKEPSSKAPSTQTAAVQVLEDIP